VGDVAEVKAIRKVFSDTSNLKMNATKSLIGALSRHVVLIGSFSCFGSARR
jgi:hypothetical protein